MDTMKMLTEANIAEISNFSITVKSVLDIVNFYGEQMFSMVELHISNQYADETVKIRYDELDSINFETINTSFLLSHNRRKAHSTVVQYIKEQAASVVHERKVVLDKLGWYRDENTVCYNAGNCIITPTPTQYDINPQLADSYKLDIDSDCGEKRAIHELFNIIHIDFRYTSILTAAGILGLLRQLIIDAGIRPPCALQVSAGTQSRKTTLTELCTRMYNRSDMMSGLGVNAARPDSSLPKISELIDNCKDCVFLLDDLFRTDDKRQKKDMERTVVGILRIYADNSARRNMQSEHKANSQLIITSEYLLNDISNVGRCFYLFIKDKVNLQRLSEAQKTPLALSTAYFYFIKYICCHYDDTVAFIKSEFNRSREQADRHIGKYERIYEMAALLTAAFKILCKYAVEKDVFASSYAEKMISSFKEQISKQVDFHCKHVELLQAQNKQINLSRTLVYLINAKKINLGSKKGGNCFKDKNYIYIKLSYFAKAIYDEYKIRLSAKFISGYFSQKYISEVYRSAKNRTNVKKIDNVNYLVLNIKALKDDAKSARDSIEKIV